MPPKGKQATKGQKQIATENVETLKFYLILIAAINSAYYIVTFFFFWEDFTGLYIFLSFLTFAIYAGSYKFMSYMSKPVMDEKGHVIDAGGDLNMPSGLAEHVKDVILLTLACQALSLLSNYFWLFLLVIPLRAFYLLWVNFLGPWFFEAAPEVDEKKQKKDERKMRRKQMMR